MQLQAIECTSDDRKGEERCACLLSAPSPATPKPATEAGKTPVRDEAAVDQLQDTIEPDNSDNKHLEAAAAACVFHAISRRRLVLASCLAMPRLPPALGAVLTPDVRGGGRKRLYQRERVDPVIGILYYYLLFCKSCGSH